MKCVLCTHLEQWAADTAAPGEQLGFQSLAQGSHLRCGQFLPEPRFEPTTVEYDDCVTICNVVNKGTPLDPELLTAGDQCCKVRQIRAVEGGPRGDGANAQGGTFSLPGHTKGQLRDFQLKDLILHSFRKFWDHK